jgi:hypothetical protein
MTTTARAIRDAMIASITALVPQSLTGYRFLASREDRSAGGVPFMDWVRSKPNLVRLFTIIDTGERRPPAVSMGGDVREFVTFEVSVAYPISNAYGPDGFRSLTDVVEEDRVQIDDAIGLNASIAMEDAYYITGESGWEMNAVDGYVVLLGRLTYEFWRSSP